MIDPAGKPSTSSPDAKITDLNVNFDGRIQVRLSDGTSFVRGQVLLQNFRNLQALEPVRDLYTNLQAAQPVSTSGLPATLGLGEIQGSALEEPVSLPELRPQPQSGVRLLVCDLFGPGVVEVSNDLAHWTVLDQASAYGGEAEFFDTETAPAGARFYRLSQSWISQVPHPPASLNR